MKRISRLMLIVLVAAALAAPALATSASPGISPDEALRILKEGNARYVGGKLQHPHQGPERRALTSGQGQHPLAAVLTCSDSRVPPEIIFDQGLGDIFVIRVAGNVAATDEIGSIEYAVDHLAAPLVVVLGHSQCGAVTAVVDDAKLPPNLANLVEPIKPAVDKAREANPQSAKDVLLKAAITDNVWQAMDDMLRLSPVIREKVKEGQVKLVGALYDLDTGQVQWLGPHPDQEKLVGAKKGAGKSGKKGKKPKKSED
ncbi:MAG: carbonic anhydrase [Deltaproteobacteria bacterium CG07_land_8_20_14_0_80_60_11]|nr:MAG: carbonic anhydrase [Deltaproteobacteria bacterium CG07_land_8_20_14_0_80_60_11]